MTAGNNLIDRIKKEFALDWNGIHGYPHWMRVKENGLVLSGKTGANTTVVKLFAVFHDSKRIDDGGDPNHGKRAADFIKSLKDDLIFLTEEELDLLLFACEKHSFGLTDADVTVQTCWDADRLDLGRVGTKPNPQFLCTPAAKDQKVIEWAYRRSLK
jgi:uncharacterized protein